MLFHQIKIDEYHFSISSNFLFFLTARSLICSILTFPTPKYLELGCAKYHPLTEDAGVIARLSVRSTPMLSFTFKILNSPIFSV